MKNLGENVKIIDNNFNDLKKSFFSYLDIHCTSNRMRLKDLNINYFAKFMNLKENYISFRKEK